MFFFFSKILSLLFYPLTWIIILLLISFYTKNQRRKKRSFLTALLLLVLFSNTFIFDRFMHAWEVPAYNSNEVPPSELGILLTGMSTYDPQINRLEFNDRTDRLMQTLALYRDGKIKTILLCGGSSSMTNKDTTEFILLKNYLVKSGIPDSVLLLEMQSRNTHENAILSKPFVLKNSPNQKPLLITSAYHMRRAVACFAKEGIQTIPYSTDRYSGPVKYEFDYLFLPSSQTLFNWEKLMHEWVGCVSYKFQGYF